MPTHPANATAQAVRILENLRTLLTTAGDTMDEEAPGLRQALAQAEAIIAGALAANRGDAADNV